MRYKIWGMLGILFISSSALAALKLAAVFSDGMVLQRDQEVPIWGWAEAGTEVTVHFEDVQKTAQADEHGKFMIYLQAMNAAAEPQMLRVQAGEAVLEVRDVLVGDVWLCSGQSNMQWPVKQSKDFENEKASADHPLIRMFITEQNVSLNPLNDCSGAWSVCSPETVGGFSAAAYFFGREIQRHIGVPVGLIHTSWGGTRIEAWSPAASLEQFPLVMKSKARQDQRAAGYSEDAAGQRFSKALEKWKTAAAAAKAEGKKAPRKPRAPVHPHKNQNYPSNLYNAMIHPLVPYGLRGAIWYQGEANAHTYEESILYRDLLENLVVQWRKDWDAAFPFYAVQLVNYRKPQVDPVEDKGWAFIRDSFLNFHKEVSNVGIAVGIDVGDEKDIHPKNKQAIGYRLAQQALAKTYKKDVVAGGPIYQSVKKDGNKMIITFDDIGSGLIEQGGGPLRRFAVAGEDRKFTAAQAVIEGRTVVVSAEGVADPAAVRYAWADNPVGCNLFNAEGFPASPFRTDDWPSTAE